MSWESRIRIVRLSSCLVVFGAVATMAHAEPVVLRYDATWAGLPAGDIHMMFDDADGGYRAAIDIDTRGLPRLLTRFRARATTGGDLLELAPRPESYDAAYDLRRRHKVVALRYATAEQGRVARRGPGDTSTHPELPAAQRRDTLDPLAVLSEIRRRAARGLRPGEGFTLAAYDGKRRFDVEGERESNSEPGTIRIRLLLRPVAGFRNPKDEEDDPEDTPRPAELTLSDDARLLPLKATVSIVYLPLTVTLVGNCAQSPCPVRLP